VLDDTVAGETVAVAAWSRDAITAPDGRHWVPHPLRGRRPRRCAFPPIVDALTGPPGAHWLADEDGFTRRGGMVSFRLEQGTVRIDVNQRPCAAPGSA